MFSFCGSTEKGLVDDSPERLVETVMHNERKFETEHSELAWAEVDFYTRGVYCAFYDEAGELLRGVTVDGLNPRISLFSNTRSGPFPLTATNFTSTTRSLRPLTVSPFGYAASFRKTTIPARHTQQ